MVPGHRRSPVERLLNLLLDAVGGALGALCRWGLGTVFPPTYGFPWLILGINVAGCLAIAALPALESIRRSTALTLLLGPGFLGGFTTLSAYAEDGRSLLADGRPALALTYLAATLIACTTAVHVARRLTPTHGGTP